MPPEPNPIGALLNLPKTELVVTFDVPLATDAAIDVPNWALAFGGFGYTINSASMGGTDVTLGVTEQVFPAAGDIVSFSPPPFDVIGTAGGLARPFIDFPVTQ